MSEKVGKRSEKVGKISEKVGKPSGKSIFSDNFPMFHPHDGNLQHWQCKFISYASDGIFHLWKWKLPTNFDFSYGFFTVCYNFPRVGSITWKEADSCPFYFLLCVASSLFHMYVSIQCMYMYTGSYAEDKEGTAALYCKCCALVSNILCLVYSGQIIT